MKKVLLVTLQSDNIGNRLQNYALQKVLSDLGCEVYTPYTDIPEWNTAKKRAKNRIKAILGMTGVRKYKEQEYRSKRIKKYKKFNKKYLTHYFKLKYDDAFNRDWSDFDYAVTGSDQVWHQWSDDAYELRFFYLDFIHKEKRISYAPSFGFDAFPEKDIAIHRKGLMEIKEVSCRERTGVKLIKNLTGRDACQVLDPTFLLEVGDWQKIGEKMSGYSEEKYLLIYFLGNKTPGYRDSINRFAGEKQLVIIDVFDKRSLASFLTTPGEFVWLVEHASYVCTDSFHATAFSIIFHKKFLVYRRMELGMEKMFDRVEDLLNLCGLSEKVFRGEIEEIEKEYEPRDFADIKTESLNYLRRALNKTDLSG